jgi:hypothetical protein
MRTLIILVGLTVLFAPTVAFLAAMADAISWAGFWVIFVSCVAVGSALSYYSPSLLTSATSE